MLQDGAEIRVSIRKRGYEVRGTRYEVHPQKFQGSRHKGLIQDKYEATCFDMITMPIDLPL